MNRILSRYIFWEFIPTFLLSIVFFTFVFLMSRILEITDYIVNYQVNVLAVLLLLLYMIPFSLEFIIPLSVMLSVLLTFLRMSGDGEIVAIKAGGISITKLLPAVLLFAFLCSLMTATMSMYALPHGRMASKKLVLEGASKHLDTQLKPRQFINSFKNVVLYINEIDPVSKELKDIFIEYRYSDELVSTMVAPLGRIFIQPDKLAVTLVLYNGTTYEVNASEGSVIPGKFDSTAIHLDMGRTLRSQENLPKDEEEMSLGELRHYLKTTRQKNDQYYISLMEWHKKFSLPIACLVLSVLAIPLGIQARSSKRSYGIGLGLFFFFLFYILLAIGWLFGEPGLYPPIIGMWMPDLVMAVLGALFFSRAIKEKPFLFPPVGRWIKNISHLGRMEITNARHKINKHR